MTAETAAALLGTSPTILSLWQERFGYPVSELTADGQQLYPDEMMIALRDALRRELSISSAIAAAQRAHSIPLVQRGPADADRQRQHAPEAAR